MASCCEHDCETASAALNPRWRRVLWAALAINAAMFAVEIGGSLLADSSALLADAVDFFGDAFNYGLSLAVLALSPLARARAAVAKGATMTGYGLFVAGHASWAWNQGVVPAPATMGAIAVLALLANATVALLLYRYRNGDANMRSVWICSRNDVLGNLAVIAAAAGVFGTAQGWPDAAVAAILSVLAVSGGIAVMRHARGEMRTAILASARRMSFEAVSDLIGSVDGLPVDLREGKKRA
jgi:Co/Zn/Cd efflux system component